MSYNSNFMDCSTSYGGYTVVFGMLSLSRSYPSLLLVPKGVAGAGDSMLSNGALSDFNDW